MNNNVIKGTIKERKVQLNQLNIDTVKRQRLMTARKEEEN